MSKTKKSNYKKRGKKSRGKGLQKLIRQANKVHSKIKKYYKDYKTPDSSPLKDSELASLEKELDREFHKNMKKEFKEAEKKKILKGIKHIRGKIDKLKKLQKSDPQNAGTYFADEGELLLKLVDLNEKLDKKKDSGDSASKTMRRQTHLKRIQKHTRRNVTPHPITNEGKSAKIHKINNLARRADMGINEIEKMVNEYNRSKLSRNSEDKRKLIHLKFELQTYLKNPKILGEYERMILESLSRKAGISTPEKEKKTKLVLDKVYKIVNKPRTLKLSSSFKRMKDRLEKLG